MSKIVSILALTAGYLPAVIVLGGLGWLAHWGHQSGWKLPRPADLAGQAEGAEEEDWCADHNVPESRCIACHPELGGNSATDWCKEHAVPESQCVLCHPEIATTGKALDWCPEHGIPESSCTYCHPEIAVKSDLKPDKDAPRVLLDPSAKQVKDPKTCQTHLLRVQFASAEAVKKAGVRLAPVIERPTATFVSANAETTLDPSRVARVASRVPGTVLLVERELGQAVKKGDLLAIIDSPDVGELKAEFLGAFVVAAVAQANVERIRPAVENGLIQKRELSDAEARHREARTQLLNAHQALVNIGLPLLLEELASLGEQDAAARINALGLTETILKTLGAEARKSTLLPLYSPASGIVIEKDVVAGEVIEAGRPLFVVADPSRLWMVANVALEDAARVSIGQSMSFRTDTSPDEAVSGKVTWIGPVVSEKTRTLRVRGEVETQGKRTPAGLFGTARITIREQPKATVVPNEAVHWEGCCHVVFVRLTDDIFQTRKVKLGSRFKEFTEVLFGLSPGEAVASHGSHVLKSEILKSNLGAGCTCVE